MSVQTQRHIQIEAKGANKQLKEVTRDFGRVKKILGEDKVKHILNQAKAKEREGIRKRSARVRDVRER
jgi:hypothetical protein